VRWHHRAAVDAHRYVRLLRHNPDFTRLYVAQLISFAGDWFATVALLGLALELTGSTAVASLVLVLQTGPFFIVSPIAGILADRFDRRRLLIAADVARAVVALGFLLARDASTLWIALVCVALLSAGAAFFEPTSSASLPNLVDAEDLPAANALMGAAWGTMLAVGAALGGVVAGILGRDAAFVLNGVSFAVSAMLIVGIRRSFRAPSEPSPGAASADGPGERTLAGGVRGLGGLRHAFTETTALVSRSPMVGALLVTKATFGVGMGVVLLLAVFATDVFRAGDAGIGLLFAARGLGALVGPFVGRRRMTGDDAGLLAVIALALGAFLLGYALLPLAPTIALGAACVFMAHLGGGTQWTLSSYGLQRAVPDAIRGRVFSFDYALVLMATTISTLVAGILTGLIGPAATLYVLIGAAAVSGVLWLAWTRPLRAATGHPSGVKGGATAGRRR
jgi:MFS family permease